MKSSLRTNSIPVLPLPDSVTILRRYIDFLEPLDSIEDKEKSLAFARLTIQSLNSGDDSGVAAYFRFLDATAREYKRICNDKLKTSHIAPLWNCMYLGNRDALPIGWNYTLHLDLADLVVRSRELNISPQALRAALIGAASFQTRRMLEHPQFFTPDSQAHLPRSCRVDLSLCPDQFTRLFRTVRIPHVGMDGLCWSHTHKVLLLRKGHPFLLNWVQLTKHMSNTDNVTALGEQWLEEILVNAKLIESVIEDTSNLPPNILSPLVLSNGGRSKWARVFEMLWTGDAESRVALRDITSCSFTISLDDEVDFSLGMHGGVFPENRYPDMNVSYAINPHGEVSCNMEHSWGDGSTMMLVSGMLHYYTVSFLSSKIPDVSAMTLSHTQSVRPIRFGRLPPVVEHEITEARQEHLRQVRETDVTVRHIRSFGTNEIKKLCRVSPDAFMHSAFHVAQRRFFGDIRSTYCALLMKKYHHGRTETLRSVSQGSKAVANAIEREKCNGDFIPAVAEALQAAGKTHRNFINCCREGNGFHRTVLLLSCIHAEVRRRISLTALNFTFDIAAASCSVDKHFFSSVPLRELSINYLSTSNITAQGISSFSFAATDLNGMGIGYCLFPDRITFTCATFKQFNRPLIGKNCKGIVFDAYADELERSIHDLYTATAKRPSSKL